MTPRRILAVFDFAAVCVARPQVVSPVARPR